MTQDILFEINEAINKDSKDVLELIFNIWLNEYKFKVKEKDFPDLHDIYKYYWQQGGLFLVAKAETKMIGTIACSKLYNNSNYG